MSQDAQTIERIVAEVVRRLGQLADTSPVAPAASGSSDNAPVSPAPPAASTKPDTLVLETRVVSTATIHGRLKGIRSVLVDSRAVVTPSVRDDLQKRGIRLERLETPAAGTNSANLTIVRYTRAADAGRAIATLPLPSGAAERVHDELPTAADCASKSVGSALQLSVLLTDESIAAVCRLNRHQHVRAAHVRNLNETRQAILAIGANVLVIDPRDVTANQWSVIVQAFRKDLPRACPQGL